MGRKYIKQIINENFIYPNDNVAEYDVEIVHDINNNCVSGTVSNFSATTVASTGITFTYNTTWALNNAEPFIRNSNALAIYSIHCIVPGQSYYKPWRLVQSRASTSIASTTFSETSATFTITPSQMGVSSFTNGTYYFEFRMIGHRCIFPICANLTISSIAPSPTATPAPTATATPVGPTPTPTATALACTSGATLNVTDTGWLKYTDCEGFDVYVQYTSTGSKTITDCLRCSTIRDGIPFADLATFTVTNCGNPCSVVTPTPTPTLTGPTPTPSATGGAQLSWNYYKTGGADGQMVLYINGNVVENRFLDSSGLINVNVGDSINCEVVTQGCTNPNNYANAYTLSNKATLVDAGCGIGNVNIFTSTYIVVSGDIGNTITLSMYSTCDSGCV